MAEKSPLVELRHLTQTFGRAEPRFVALSDINLTLYEGELMALVGPSGCGKSTLLRLITGLEQATRGEVLYRGSPLSGVNPNATIVFQSFALFPWFTVQQNVEIALTARGISSKVATTRSLEL